MYYTDEDIKKATRIFPLEGRNDYLRLDMNENPIGLPQPFVEDVKKSITPSFLATYPEQSAFKRKYAKSLGLTIDNIATTNGSDEAIRMMIEIFSKKGGEVVGVSPTFEMYPVNCMIFGRKWVGVPYDSNYHININNILSSIGGNTNMVALVNPNNPMGNVYSLGDLRLIIAKARDNNSVVVIDEAYFYFCDSTAISLIKEFDNLIILRTFSKMYSMAGLRLGIVISNPDIVKLVNNLRLSFNVNSMALLFAEKLMDNPSILKEMEKEYVEGRRFVESELKSRGYKTLGGKGNFLFFVPKTDPYVLAKRLEEHNVLVKTYSNSYLNKFIRINAGPIVAMKQFLMELDVCDR